MRHFAQKPKITPQARGARAKKHGRTHFEPDATTHFILHLQRTIGNQAVQRFLQANRLSAEEAPTVIRPLPHHQITQTSIQRQADFGLAASKSITGYASKVKAYQHDRANQDKSFEDLTRHAVKVFNDELQAIDVPIVKNLEIKPIDSAAQFRAKGWAIDVNPTKYTGKSGPLKIKELKKQQLTDLIESIYHEARHAEQHFKVARLLAGQRKSELEIEHEAGVAQEIAKQAKAKPLTSITPEIEEFSISLGEQSGKKAGDDPKLIAKRTQDARKRIVEHNQEVQQVEEWHREKPLIDLIYDRSYKIRAALSRATEEVKKRKRGSWDLSKLQEHTLEPVKKDLIPQFDMEIKRVSAQKNRAQMVTHLGSLRKNFAELIQFIEQQTKSQTLIPEFQLIEIDAALIEAELAEAYKHLLTEADAYKQASKVTKAMQGK